MDSFADTHEGDSLLASIVAAEADPDRLSADEAVAFLTFLYQAGGGPTAMMLGNAMLTLLRHPDQWCQLREDPSLARSALDRDAALGQRDPRPAAICSRRHDAGGKAHDQGRATRCSC